MKTELCPGIWSALRNYSIIYEFKMVWVYLYAFQTPTFWKKSIMLHDVTVISNLEDDGFLTMECSSSDAAGWLLCHA